ncbi:little elongation complex subunit 1 isoform X1 [Dipodomys merriami]|uniref:little elongation complex subunit 1 isoform X1 n=2 Tax=Dipodomys merriami TaxID=94247 RepID=UPI0038558EF9
MMPGETHSAAPGTAADLAQCQGCASLQQNLNEYVEALITLKQKIINTDNLLTEYQKKCDELQFARRENSTLHHQVEQMLQKISPLQKCQEELGSLKAELEEKKSSLKLYQASHQEYARVKEECLKSDAQKKKLEAKVKKLEEAAVKQTQDFKQLRIEKKILEKEFKKTQERLDEFSKQKNEKGLRHIGTQISSDSYGSIDKRKVKLLLKELWLCVNTAHRLPGDIGRHTPEKIGQDDSSFTTSREDDTPSPSQGSPSRASGVQTCQAELSMEVEESFAPCESVAKERPFGAGLGPGRAPNEVLMRSPDEEDRAGASAHAPLFDEDLQAAIDFFRLPLPLVSPVPSPPLTSSTNHLRPLPSLLAPETYFGEYTDSSDNEFVPHEDSAEDDDTADSQACFGLARKNKGNGTWEERPKSKETVQVLNKFAVNEVKTVGCKTLAAPLGEASATSAFAQETRWTVPPDFLSCRGRLADEGFGERRRSVQAEQVLPGPSRSLSVEKLSGGLSGGREAEAGKSGLYFMPLGKRPLNELIGSDEKASSSKKIGSPHSEFIRYTLADEFPSTSGGVTGCGSFPKTPRETAKEREDDQESTSESSESEDDDPGDGLGPVGQDSGTKSSSTSMSVSNFSHPQPSKLQYVNIAEMLNKTMPTQLLHSEQTLPTRNLLLAQSEPPEPSPQGSNPGSRLCSLSPGLESLTFRNQRSRQTAGANMAKDTTRISLSQSVFRKMTNGGQSESRDPKSALPSTGSESGLSERDRGCDQSTSWHHNDSVRRGGEESPSATSEHEQKSSHQLEKAETASQNGASSATLELPRENASPASLLLSPALVTMGQASPEQDLRGNVDVGHRENELTSAPEEGDNHADDVPAAECAADPAKTTGNVQEGPAQRSTSPELSVSCSKLDFDSQGGPVPAENVDCSTSRRLSFSSEDAPCQSQDSKEAARLEEGPGEALGEAPRPSQAPPAPDPDPLCQSQDSSKEASGLEEGPGEALGGTPWPSQAPPSPGPDPLCQSQDSSKEDAGCEEGSREGPGRAQQPSLAPPAPDPDPLCQSQDSSKEDAGCEEGLGGAPQPSQALPAPDPDHSGVESGELLPTESARSGDRPAEESPCGHAGSPGGDALAVANDSATMRQSCELSRVTSPAPPASPQPDLPTATGLSGVPFRSAVEMRGIPSSSLPGTPERGEESSTDGSEPFSCSEGELEGDAVAGSGRQQTASDAQSTAGGTEGAAPAHQPAVDVGYLTLALQDFNISAFPDIDRLSTSDVAVFLESCQLQDYSSGDSVSECSSKGTEMSKELKQSGVSGEKCEEQLCEEETAGTSEEWIESEKVDSSLKSPRQLVQCSLETLTEVLTKIGQELQPNCEDCDDADSGDLSLVSVNSPATEALKESGPSEGASGSTPHSPEQFLLVTEEHVEDRSGGLGSADAGKGGLAAPADSPVPASVSVTQSRMEQSSGYESETFQIHTSAGTSEVTDTRSEKDQTGGTEKEVERAAGGTAASPTADTPQAQEEVEAASVSMASTENSPETGHTAPPFQEPPSGSAFTAAQGEVSGNSQSANFDKSRLRNRPVKPSIWISSQIYDQTFEAQNVASDHTYYNSKLEPSGKNKTRSKISNKDPSNKPVKTSASKGEVHTDVPQSLSGESGMKSQRGQTQPVLAQADTSGSTDGPVDTLSKIRQEVGPPLPPLLAPLIATPPRAAPAPSPLLPSPSSPASPLGKISPACEIPVPPLLSPWPEEPLSSSPPEPSPSPSPAAGGRILSSPLQFCAATPKHALPVPGRLPPCAPGPAAVAVPQENSVKILDTMYPELSARARTLSILKGNMQLSRGTSADGKTLPGRVSALLGLKAITSTSTAFVKTGSSSGGDSCQGRSRDLGPQQAPGSKRTLSASAPRSAKRLRLDSESPEPEPQGDVGEGVHGNLPEHPRQAEVTTEERSSVLASSPVPQLLVSPKETVESHDQAILHALKKVAESSFDLLPVIRSHVYVGNISKKPVMRDQEKEVVFEFSTRKKHLAERLLRSILSELKLQKKSIDHSYIHALCRVYVGICRQLGDLERARLFCYSLLKEDFPESEKLALFIANMWHDVFVSQSVISKAMQLVARQRAKGEVLSCLRAFLNWEKSAPVDVGVMVSKLLLTIQLCPKTEFQSSETYGEDLSGDTWEYIFAIDLLCCHQKWIWTHDNIISKELWPVMDKWIKYRKGHANIAFTPDVIIASVLRLIGRLGQLGLKEGFPTAVKNISSVIGTFIQHAQDEDIPWGIQLAAVYALCDLSPSNPAQIAQVLEGWRRAASNSVPSALLGYLEEVGTLGQEGEPRATP